MSSLPAATARRSAKAQVLAILKSLPPQDWRIVLEDLLEEIYSASVEPPALRAITIDPSRLNRMVKTAIETQTLSEKILEWCKQHPTEDGVYPVRAAAKTLLPLDQNGTSKIYSSVLRNSPQSDRTKPRKPRFEWLGDGKFKLFNSAS